MNILDLQDKLKNFSQDQLVREMQMPTGQMPQFLLLSEITRRQKMKNDHAQQQGREQSTVAQDAINAAGMPQDTAQQLAGTMAPQTDMAGNTGAMPQQMMPEAPQPVQGMAGGGIVALQEGGPVESSPRMFVRNGMIIVVDDEGREVPYGYAPVSDDYLTLPSQTELDQRYRGGARDAARPLDRMRTGMDAPSIGDVPAIGADAQPGAPRAASSLDAPFTNRLDRGLPGIPQEDYLTLPSQADLDQRYNAELFGIDQMRAGMASPLNVARVGPIGADTALGAPRAAPRMAAPYSAVPQPSQSVSDVARILEESFPGSGYEDVMRGGPRMPPLAPASREARPAIPDMLPVMTAQPFPIVGQGLEGIVPPPAEVPRAPRAPRAPQEFIENFEYDAGGPPSAGVLERVFGAPALERIGVPTLRSPAEETTTTGAPLAVPDGGIETLLPPEAPMADPTVTPPGGPGGGGPGGGGPGGGGGIAGAAAAAGAPSSFEQELINMLAAREKRATQDKWLALAQAGMQLMSSNQPTFGGALGEAGSAGLAALREVAPSAEADRLALLGQLEQSRLSRQALAARAAGGGGGGGGRGRAIPAAALGALASQMEAVAERLSDPINPPTPDEQMQLARQRDALQQQQTMLTNMYMSQFGLPGAVAEEDSGVYSMDDVTE